MNRIEREGNMSRKALLIVAALALMAVMTVASAQAQDELTASIPFAFRAGNVTLPGGDYSFKTTGYQHVWLIQGQMSAFTFVISPEANKGVESAKLVFHRYGDTYFLSQICGLGNTYDIPVAKAEREIAREMARNNTKPESGYAIVVASLR